MKKTMLAVMAMSALMLVGCGKNKQYDYLRDRALPVEIEVVGQEFHEVTDAYVGEILAKAEVPLVFPLGGQLTSIDVKSGESVKKGQVIATVDNTQASALLESAEAMLRQANDAYTRLKPVYEKGGMSEVQWMDLQTKVEKAQSMMISAQKRYDDCTLKAAYDGVVNLNDIETGQQLGMGQPIGKLLDMTGRKATFTVPEKEIGGLNFGEKVMINLPALELSISAKVDEKSLVSTHLAHTYRVTAELDKTKDLDDLLPGMVCRVLVKSKMTEGQIISASCIQTQQTGHSVWVLRNGRAERQMVKIEAFVQNGVLIGEGLQIGDTVISKGYQKMFKGARVEY